ncbi:hypothetical protein DVH24_032902 [Malus domestica]|uniref:Uncharacterized protein n=1 Tax=Malus domestica TaxID=3750 RepID=A0A498IM44_MALDO|nr:hypothetical protein DVH24_032902 [Malus domestica]
MPSQEFCSIQITNPLHLQSIISKLVRAREKDEPQPPSTLNKLPKCFSKVTCGMCGKKGHNCTTCEKKQRQASQAYGEAGRGHTCGTNEIGHNSPTTKSGQTQAMTDHATGGNMGSETPPNQGQEQSASNASSFDLCLCPFLVSKRGSVKRNAKGKSVHNSRKPPENRRI